MSIVSALKSQQGSIRELALLPQQEILKLAQSGQLNVSLVPVVLNEKALMIKQAAQMQAMGQPQPPTVVEQAMATNAQDEAQPQANMGIAAAPMRQDMYQEQNYAGGGIVAFANGGLSDDDEDDEVETDEDRADKENEALLRQLIAAYRVNRPSDGETETSGSKPIKANSGLYVNPYLADYIRKRETGGFRGDPNLAVSPKGAMGIMQIMPSTAMRPGFGVPDIFSLADQLGIPYEDKSEESAKKLLTIPEINKTFGEMYAGAMEKKFGDPRLVAAAYNAGPKAVERAGGVPNIAETQKYVAGISPERYEAARKSVQEARREQLGLPPMGAPVTTEGLGSTFDPYLQATTPPAERAPAPGIPGSAAAIDQIANITQRGVAQERQALANLQRQYEAQNLQEGYESTPARLIQAAAGAEEKPAAELDPLEALLRKREQGIAAQREQDKYMAILAAGLGMLGGTSPYALTNIGAGGMKGVESLAASQRLRAAEENALLSGRIGQYKAQQYEGMRKDLAQQQNEYKYTQQISKDYNAALQSALNRRKVAALEELGSPADRQAVIQEAEESLMSNPGFLNAYKRLYGSDYTPSAASAYRVIGPKKGQ